MNLINFSRSAPTHRDTVIKRDGRGGQQLNCFRNWENGPVSFRLSIYPSWVIFRMIHVSIYLIYNHSQMNADISKNGILNQLPVHKKEILRSFLHLLASPTLLGWIIVFATTNDRIINLVIQTFQHFPLETYLNPFCCSVAFCHNFRTQHINQLLVLSISTKDEFSKKCLPRPTMFIVYLWFQFDKCETALN